MVATTKNERTDNMTTLVGQGRGNRTPGGVGNQQECTGSFDDMGLAESILRGVYEYGLENPFGVQQLAIRPLIQGRDVFVQAGAGRGKSVALIIGALQRVDPSMAKTQALILVPTRELAASHYRCICALANHSEVTRVCVEGSGRRDARLAPHVAIGTPGTVTQLIESRCLSVQSLKVVMIDGADELLKISGENGFREQIRDGIILFVPENCQIGVSSTVLSKGDVEVNNFMTNVVGVTIQSPENPFLSFNHFHISLERDDWKRDTLLDLLDHFPCETRILVFVRSSTRSKYLMETLLENNIPVAISHAEMEMNLQERREMLDHFHRGLYRVLVTSATLATRGPEFPPEFTFPSVVCIHYDFPRYRDDYLRRNGLFGWGGWVPGGTTRRKRLSISFVTDSDMPLLREIEESYDTTVEGLPANFADLI